MTAWYWLAAGLLACCAIVWFLHWLWVREDRVYRRRLNGRGGYVAITQDYGRRRVGRPYDQADEVDHDALWEAIARKDPRLQRMLDEIKALPEDAA